MAKVFFSYAHEDEALRDKLETHLSLLKRQGVIETWHDRRIGPGDAFGDDIDTALETSDIVLLLVSADFLASDYCHDIEMRRALERHAQGLARVVPIILRIPRTFSDRDRDRFFDEGLQYLSTFFESSLQELQSRYDEVETSFRRIDADRFETAIYVNGAEQTRCGIWRSQEQWSAPGLRYSNSGVGNGNSFNESLSVENDGYTQFWKPMGMSLMRRNAPEQMTHHGTAEYLWDILIGPLRRN